MRCKIIDDDLFAAYHEAGHVIVGTLINVPCRYATIEPQAHVEVTIKGVVNMALCDTLRAIFYLSGMCTEKYLFPLVEIDNSIDEEMLWGLPEARRVKYEVYILLQLHDPAVRLRITQLAARLFA